MLKNLSLSKFLSQRGQVLVLYALLIPFLLMFVGVGLDLGWYYLNVSRLQNAADAAALAGAKVIVDASNNIYFTNGLTTNSLPGDILDYTKISTYNFGQLRRYEEKLPGFNSEAFINSRVMAENYTRKNLADYNKPDDTSGEKNKLTAVDGWSISVKDKDKEVKGTVSLYAKVFDVRSDIITPMYYTVELNEKIRHFFMPGWFDDMNAPVRAVVLLRPHDTDLFSNVQRLESKEVIGNWEYQNYYKNRNEVYSGKWQQIQDGKIHYTQGNTYRTEKVTVNGGNSDKDSLNIDFRADVWLQMGSDWDIGYAPTLRKENQSRKTMAYNFTDGWGANLAQNKRVLFTANFDTPYNTRNSYLESGKTDPLWIRIESDPIQDLTYIGKPNHEVYNSVRQITLNFNKDNTAKYPAGHKYAGQYKYRPLVIFYDGPENIDYAVDEDGNQIRKSQPVVVNLNADFNGIIFAPNSPAIINGNGYTWNGFIIAKEFLAAKTAEDFTNNEAGYTKVTDSYGDTLYLKWDEAKTKSELETTYGNGYKIGTDSKGNLVIIPSTVTDYTKVSKNDAANWLTFTLDGEQYTINRKWLEQEPLKGATTTPSTNVVKIFRKVTCDNEEKYIDEVGTDYYQLVNDGKNPIIVDRNGNIQTKDLPAGSYEQNPYFPLDADWEKIVDGHPYRIKSEENVYEREAFNLSDKSFYNSFNIPELERKVYTYLDGYLTENPSPDMFFTATRASWID